MRGDVLRRHGYSVAALRLAARKRLPRMIFDMVDGAAGDEHTMRRNEAALAALEFVPRLLAGAPRRDQGVTLFGKPLPSPIIIGPTGLAGLLWPRAELAAARAASRLDAIYTVSHASTCSIEDIAAASPGRKWMQVFLTKDRGITAEFAERAAAAGYEALVLTVDNQVVAGRDRDARNGMSFPLRVSLASVAQCLRHPLWLARMAGTPNPTFINYLHNKPRASLGAFGAFMVSQLDPSVTWADVDWLRARWTGPLIIKGLLHPEEAREAARRGADAVIVSNHGGRQLDGAIPSILALRPIVDAVAADIPVLVDGGFRRGADIVKALALGARAVLIARPHLWGLAVAGEEGVAHVLTLLRGEIDRAMALGGWDSIAALTPDIFSRASIAAIDQHEQGRTA